MSLLGDLGTVVKNKLGGTSVDNTVPRYNGTTCTMQGSGVTISDTNVVTASGGFVGNATTATKLQTARKINGVDFDGTADITIPSIPTGGIIMWSGSIVSIPTGWALCNGQNGTPNLQDRFVIGAGSAYAVSVTGGSKDAIVVSHTHTISGSVDTKTIKGHFYLGGNNQSSDGTIFKPQINTGARPGLDYNSGSQYKQEMDVSHNHTFSATSATTGSDGTNANLPPYYALAYIMKL